MRKILFRFGRWLCKIATTQEERTQKENEKLCIDVGHLWGTKFNPKWEINKPVNERVYCKRCGVIYSKVEHKSK